jgi:hypothetical protein
VHYTHFIHHSLLILRSTSRNNRILRTPPPPRGKIVPRRKVAVAHSVQRLGTGSSTEGQEFESWLGKEFSVFQIIQTGSVGPNNGYRRLSPPRDWSWPLTYKYCRGKENVDLYLHSPICVHDIVLSWLSTATTLTLPKDQLTWDSSWYCSVVTSCIMIQCCIILAIVSAA